MITRDRSAVPRRIACGSPATSAGWAPSGRSSTPSAQPTDVWVCVATLGATPPALDSRPSYHELVLV